MKGTAKDGVVIPNLGRRMRFWMRRRAGTLVLSSSAIPRRTLPLPSMLWSCCLEDRDLLCAQVFAMKKQRCRGKWLEGQQWKVSS